MKGDPMMRQPFMFNRRGFRAPNKMIVAPRASVLGSGKEGDLSAIALAKVEAGHPRMVDGA